VTIRIGSDGRFVSMDPKEVARRPVGHPADWDGSTDGHARRVGAKTNPRGLADGVLGQVG
jgi:hypothetical protein